ncbi:3-phosphoshikimate 1-carboxyvinyltransferase [Streptomyces sp. NBC_00986]|uniref:3-phosphoshikimate 1-carboxyvinyltransferase n=1 Tax=Streptomyces sp. NBC_00986 TaxID=2903702 RepID=UPI0038649327|nr:hypothetical protein OG504_07915 [Streptomyces sp. NBC_00986]
MDAEALTVLRGSVRVPTSKPHTQRALLMAALADGESTIRRPNVCSESTLVQEAATALGSRFEAQGEQLVVRGVAGRPQRPAALLQVAGSGFALRHLLPIAALAPAPCVLSGSRQLAARPLQPLLDALAGLGGRAEPADRDLVLPIATWSTGLTGGRLDVPADETSQFVSALMLTAPYAAGPVRIGIPGVLVSKHYIRMTGEMMARFGAHVMVADDLRTIEVEPSGYRATKILVGPDVTSLFYFVAAAVVADADILVEDVELGEDLFLDSAVALGRRLGVRITQEGTNLRIRSGERPAEQVEIDASDLPTLVPALAAVASSLPHGMVLQGARHIHHHKTSRLQVVLDELARLGRVLRPHYRDGQLDGFETDCVEPAAAEQVDAQGDHRNFMALFLATLAVERPVHVLGANTLSTSFADFLTCFQTLTTTPARV